MKIEYTLAAKGALAVYEDISSKPLICFVVLDVNGSHVVEGLIIHRGKVMLANEVEGFKGYQD
jgi:hypothetical protein